jgi:hypothetical protein
MGSYPRNEYLPHFSPPSMLSRRKYLLLVREIVLRTAIGVVISA